MMLMPSLWKMLSKARLNFVSRSWIREARALAAVVEVHQQVPRLLHHPRPIRVARTGEVLDPPRPDRDEEQHVQPPQPDGIHGENVASNDRAAVLAQERSPAELAPFRRWRDAGTGEHVSHQRRRDVDTELAQLADDPDVPPVAVLAREPQDQLAQLRVERRPARAPVPACPAAGDDPPVPPQQRLRRDQERLPRATRHYAAEGRQQQSVALRQLWPPRLPAQDRQLVPQHEDLEFHRAVAAREQQHEREQPAGDDVDEQHEHGQPPRRDRRRYRAPSEPTPRPRAVPPDRVCAPHGLRCPARAPPRGAARTPAAAVPRRARRAGSRARCGSSRPRHG
jgi:hypothetical protein